MNYIKKLQKENELYKECIEGLNRYLRLNKFDMPNNWVNTHDIQLRIKEYTQLIKSY